MKPLHDSIQVSLNIPKHVDQTLKNLGYQVDRLYQSVFYDGVRAYLDTVSEVPAVRGAQELLEQEVRHIDED